MAFWNKSEDPWDRKPEKRQAPTDWTAEETGPEPGLLDRLKDWNEARKAEQARKAAEETPDPIPCPWCGKLMEVRYLWGGRGIYLGKKRPGFFSSGMDGENWDFCDEGNLISGVYKTAWYCKDCRKLVAKLPPEPESLVPRTQQEYEDELRRYAEQANKREEEN